MTLSPNQIKAAELLAQGNSQQDVASSLGLSRKTIWRWLQQENFKNLSFGLVNRPARIQENPKPQSFQTEACINLTPQDLIPDALAVVRDILRNTDCRPADKLKAATLIGHWTGLELDFNVALSALRRYGLVLHESNGAWMLLDQREKQFDE